jgi:hypothetical protein
MNEAARRFWTIAGKTAFGLVAAFNAFVGVVSGVLVLVFHDNLSPVHLWGHVGSAMMALHAVTSVWAFIKWLRSFDSKAAIAVLCTIALYALALLVWHYSGVTGFIH